MRIPLRLEIIHEVPCEVLRVWSTTRASKVPSHRFDCVSTYGTSGASHQPPLVGSNVSKSQNNLAYRSEEL